MGRLHVLTQYVWPDDAPTAIYAAHVADSLRAKGADVVLVGGSGTYRSGASARPATEIVRVEHRAGRRGNVFETMVEYASVTGAFRRYISDRVGSGDIVVATSAPPTSVLLADEIARRGACSVYWLQDYYPELVRSLLDLPGFARRPFAREWDRRLARWSYVVKAAGNLGYRGEARLIRNWPALELGEAQPFVPRRALYTGNFGWGHGVEAFLEVCESLRREGFEIVVRGDGPGLRKMPPWIELEPPLLDAAALARSYWEAEVHLVAAHPRFEHGNFPSKLWNALATGRRIVASGFRGAMADELSAALASPYRLHRQQWIDFLSELAGLR